MSGGKGWLLPPSVPTSNVWRERGRKTKRDRNREKVGEERPHGPRFIFTFLLACSTSQLTKSPLGEKNMWRQLKLQLSMSDTEHETQILMKASFGKMSCLLAKKESSLETLLIFWQKNSCKRFDGKT